MVAHRILEDLDQALNDDATIKFGTGDDVTLGFDGTNLQVLPATDDTGTFHYGDGTTDLDVKMFLGSTTEYVLFDVGNSRLFCNAPLWLANNSGAAPANAVLMGSGQSGSEIDMTASSAADHKFLEFRCRSAAATGDNRLLYMRYQLGGVAGGECLRAFTVVNENVGTAHGAHLSLAFTAAAGASECSGLGVACRGTLHIPDIASWAPTGTYAAGMFEIYSDGDDSDPAGMTELAVLQLSNSGDATGKADVDTDAVLISVQGFTVGNEAADKVYVNTITAGTINANCTEALKIKIGANIRFIPIATATT